VGRRPGPLAQPHPSTTPSSPSPSTNPCSGRSTSRHQKRALNRIRPAQRALPCSQRAGRRPRLDHFQHRGPTTTTAGAITRARAIALRAADGGRITEIEQDDEDSRQVWKVKVKKGSVTRKVSIDQQTGKVLKIERDTDDNDDNN
jgi:uncharacterized membrane protein YkoI